MNAAVQQQCIAAIHQPTFFPWQGYFDKIRRCSVFVVLDHVPLQKTGGTWSNRVKMFVGGRAQWVTAPIERAHHGQKPISEVRFDESVPWRAKVLNTVRSSYGRAPHFREAMALLEPQILREEPLVARYNLAAITAIADALGLDTRKFVLSSSLSSRGGGTALLIDLAREVGADAYLCGDGAGGYQDDDAILRSGLGLVRQGFRQPSYPQAHGDAFVAGLSIVDTLVNCGIDGTRQLLWR